MVKVIATLRARPDTIEQTRQALTSLVEPSREERGCVAYQLVQSNEDPTEFVTVEQFVDDAAVDAHMGTAHVQAALAAAGDLLGAAPQIRRYSLLA